MPNQEEGPDPSLSKTHAPPSCPLHAEDATSESIYVDLLTEKLPNELQCEIFELAIHSHDSEVSLIRGEQVHLPGSVPLRLAHITAVCQSWRRIAIDYSLLWNEIDLSRPSFALLSIERSNDAPLNIRLRLDQPSPKDAGDSMEYHEWLRSLEARLGDAELPLYKTISRHSHRVRTVEAHADAIVLHPILGHVLRQGKFPSLTRLGCCILGPLRSWLLWRSWTQIQPMEALMENAPYVADLFDNLEAPALQHLHLELPRFQRFSSLFNQLTTIELGCTAYFTFVDFQNFCHWLPQLTQLSSLSLDDCKLPSFPPLAIPAEASHEYFTTQLRSLFISYSDGRLGAAARLLRMIQPGQDVRTIVKLGPHLPVEELCTINIPDFLDLAHLVIQQTTPSIYRLLLFCIGSNELGVAARGRGYLAGARAEQSSSFSLHTSSVATDLARAHFKELAMGLFTGISIPLLESLTFSYPYTPSRNDWASFLARHPAITSLKAEHYQCHGMLRALTTQESNTSAAVDLIKLKRCSFDSQRQFGFSAESWKALCEYVQTRHKLGQPLPALQLVNCNVLTDTEVDFLKQYVENVVLDGSRDASGSSVQDDDVESDLDDVDEAY